MDPVLHYARLEKPPPISILKTAAIFATVASCVGILLAGIGLGLFPDSEADLGPQDVWFLLLPVIAVATFILMFVPLLILRASSWEASPFARRRTVLAALVFALLFGGGWCLERFEWYQQHVHFMLMAELLTPILACFWILQPKSRT